MKKKNVERLPLEQTSIDTRLGLTGEQIAERLEKGHVNDVKIGTSRSVANIIFSNTLTFFNVLCFLVFAWILSIAKDFNDFKNCTFMLIIVVNTLIGIIQEIRAKRTIDRLSLLSSPKVNVLRDGIESVVEVNQVVRDDLMLLSAGSQVCSDAVIVEGEVEVNESMLTGESKARKRKEGELLLSGSYIVTGRCRARVKNVAEENYIQQLAIEAKRYKREPSELMRSLNLIMKVLTVIILIFAVPSFLSNFSLALTGAETPEGLFWPLFHLSHYSKTQIFEAYRIAVMPTSGALIGMIPAGLFLMTSVALSVGVIRLGRKKAQVNGLYSIETLARVNMLCLDKTGTITDGTMKVVDVIPLRKNELSRVKQIVASMQAALEDNNQTSLALREYFGYTGSMKKQFAIPFSSERKCSAVKFVDDNLYLLGAPEYVCKTMRPELAKRIDKLAAEGARCLLLAENGNSKVNNRQQIPDASVPVAIVVIEDNIKSDAKTTIRYFKENGVDVRVISGDNPVTVSQIAKKVGIERAEKFLSLQNMSDDEIRAVANNYTVFGRVSPAQKKLLIQIFKAAGNTVAMTGDGINDILALKEADCSIAMANGSEATRNVAQLVLMDSNFSSMPLVVGEGRRVVNNIERASTLFLMKTLFTFLLQFALIFMQISYPIEPVKLSFISFFAIGAPALFLALEPNNNRIQGNFLANIAKRVFPGALAIMANVLLIILFRDYLHLISMTDAQRDTMIMVTVFTVFLLVLGDICKPYTPLRMVLMGSVLVASIAIIIISPLVPNQVFNLFNIAPLYELGLVTLLISLMCLSYFIVRLSRWVIKKLDQVKLFTIKKPPAKAGKA